MLADFIIRNQSAIVDGARARVASRASPKPSEEELDHDYGDVCQTITELATDQDARIPSAEFQTLNLCLDDAIAGAVTEFASTGACAE
jgi:hypothetical protein